MVDIDLVKGEVDLGLLAFDVGAEVDSYTCLSFCVVPTLHNVGGVLEGEEEVLCQVKLGQV